MAFSLQDLENVLTEETRCYRDVILSTSPDTQHSDNHGTTQMVRENKGSHLSRPRSEAETTKMIIVHGAQNSDNRSNVYVVRENEGSHLSRPRSEVETTKQMTVDGVNDNPEALQDSKSQSHGVVEINGLQELLPTLGTKNSEWVVTSGELTSEDLIGSGATKF